MSIQLPQVSAKITADASGLVSEMRKAETATSVTAAKIDHELEHLKNSLTRRFSLSHTGLDVLKGLGIGSGFHLFEKASELLTEHWRAAEEAAKKITAETEKQLKLFKEIAALQGRYSKENKYSDLKAEGMAIAAQIRDLIVPKDAHQIATEMTKGEWLNIFGPDAGQLPGGEISPEKLAKAQELRTRMLEIMKEMAATRADIEKDSKKENDVRENAAEKAAAEIQKMGDEIRSAIETPKDELERALGDISAALALGAITIDEANRAADQAQRKYNKWLSGQNKAPSLNDLLSGRFVDDLTARGGSWSKSKLGISADRTLGERQLSVLEEIRDQFRKLDPTSPSQVSIAY